MKIMKTANYMEYASNVPENIPEYLYQYKQLSK